MIQRSHLTGFAQNYQLPGPRLVPIGGAEGATLEEHDAAISERTAAVAFLGGELPGNARFPTGAGLAEIVELAHRRGVPVIVDAAAELPPAGAPAHIQRAGRRPGGLLRGQGAAGPAVFRPGARPGGADRSLPAEQRPRLGHRAADEGGQGGGLRPAGGRRAVRRPRPRRRRPALGGLDAERDRGPGGRGRGAGGADRGPHRAPRPESASTPPGRGSTPPRWAPSLAAGDPSIRLGRAGRRPAVQPTHDGRGRGGAGGRAPAARCSRRCRSPPDP